MLNVGDIVKPKEGYKGSRYIFGIKKIDESNFPYMYQLERIEQELDPVFGPIDFQNSIINETEHLGWAEEELELITPFYDIPKINPGGWVLRQENSVKNKEDNMKILDIYKERKEEAILKDYEEKEKKILEEDEIQSIIKEMTEQVNTILKNEGRKDKLLADVEGFCLEETSKKLAELNEAKTNEIAESDKIIEEIKALFELTQDYEERMKILKKYDIINKDGKLTI